jgi:hypothetical protein
VTVRPTRRARLVLAVLASVVVWVVFPWFVQPPEPWLASVWPVPPDVKAVVEVAPAPARTAWPGEVDCRPCDNDARLTCCFPSNTVELDDAAKRTLNFAFNLEGVVGEHDRLLQEAAARFAACDRRYADADARIARLEERVRDLAIDVRALQRARGRRR